MDNVWCVLLFPLITAPPTPPFTFYVCGGWFVTLIACIYFTVRWFVVTLVNVVLRYVVRYVTRYVDFTLLTFLRLLLRCPLYVCCCSGWVGFVGFTFALLWTLPFVFVTLLVRLILVDV